MIIAVDFDGTIVPDIFFPHKMPDRFMPGAKETLIELHRRGHALVLWTLRDSDRWKVSRTLQIAVDFLNANGLGFMILPRHIGGYEPNTPKFPADLYIDDKIPGSFQGWDAIRQALIHDCVPNSPATIEGDEADGMSSNSGRDSRTDNLNLPGVAEVGRKAGSINESVHGPLTVWRENNWYEAKPLNKPGRPLDSACLDCGTLNHQRPVQLEVYRARMTCPYTCFGLEKLTPLEWERLIRDTKARNDHTAQCDSAVHADPDRQEGKDD